MIGLMFFLTGCPAAVIVGGATATTVGVAKKGYEIGTDERSLNTQIEDKKIETEVKAKLVEDSLLGGVGADGSLL